MNNVEGNQDSRGEFSDQENSEEHLISIITPAFNREKYLSDAINSALNQDYQNIEIIIVDDGSTDNTSSIVKEFINQDSKIKYYFQENSGVSSARNHGLRKARGKYIVFLDSDDVLLPGAISLMHDALQKNKPAKLVYGDLYVEQNGVRHLCEYPPPLQKPLLFLQFFERNIISMNSVMLEKGCIKENNYFDEDIPCSEDFDFWARLISSIEIIKINEPLSVYRYHSGQSIKDMGMIRYYTDYTCYKYLHAINFEALFDFCQTNQEKASKMRSLAMSMLKRPAAPYDTVLEILKKAQEVHFDAKFENHIIQLNAMIPTFLKNKYNSDLRLDDDTKQKIASQFTNVNSE